MDWNKLAQSWSTRTHHYDMRISCSFWVSLDHLFAYSYTVHWFHVTSRLVATVWELTVSILPPTEGTHFTCWWTSNYQDRSWMSLSFGNLVIDDAMDAATWYLTTKPYCPDVYVILINQQDIGNDNPEVDWFICVNLIVPLFLNESRLIPLFFDIVRSLPLVSVHNSASTWSNSLKQYMCLLPFALPLTLGAGLQFLSFEFPFEHILILGSGTAQPFQHSLGLTATPNATLQPDLYSPQSILLRQGILVTIHAALILKRRLQECQVWQGLSSVGIVGASSWQAVDGIRSGYSMRSSGESHTWLLAQVYTMASTPSTPDTFTIIFDGVFSAAQACMRPATVPLLWDLDDFWTNGYDGIFRALLEPCTDTLIWSVSHWHV